MKGPTTDSYDVAIAGGGPAGSSLAIRLASAGLKVLLAEQKKFPRAKLCGEFISPECLDHFHELGILDQISVSAVQIERTVFYAQNGRALAVSNEWFQPGSSALALSRAAMDNVLLMRARSVGVEVLEETYASGLVFEGDCVAGLKLRDNDQQTFGVRSQLTVDATGRTRALARHLDRSEGNTGAKTRADFVALKNHLVGASVPDGDCEIYSYRGGYGGCVRVENDVHNLCFIVPAYIVKRYRGNAAEIMQNIVLKNKQAARSLSAAEAVGDWLAVPIENYGRADLSPAMGLLTVGDAAAFIDPFTGSGILLALESSKVAAAVIESTVLNGEILLDRVSKDYASMYAAAFTSRHRASSMLRRAAFVPFLAEIVIRGLSMSDSLTKKIAMATRNATSSPEHRART